MEITTHNPTDLVTFILALMIVIMSSVLGPILVAKYKTYLIKQTSIKDPLLSSIEFNKLVDEQLLHIKDKLEIDRIWISQFHNGGHFFPTGKSISKFSITFEHSNPGLQSISEIFKNIPVSLFNESLKKLYEDNEVLIPDFKKGGDLGLNKFSLQNPPISTYIFSLKTLDNIFIGSMGIEFTNEQVVLSEDEIQFLRNKSIAIGAIVSTYLYQNN